ncbi:acyltransferase [Patescibacteria group bacterium]|jgi:peptidoglycan/LPS O-acetylase OafA/YrhL|nr:acyltransferase [Patescibacteria group bacterium]
MGPARFAISDPSQQTWWFILILILAILITIRPNKEIVLSKNTTLELKGFAILAVVFGHIGFFLSQDDRFLFPLSIFAGVGVNLFLFLSGFGLTRSAKARPFTIWSFYRDHAPKLFVPLWIVLSVLFMGDTFLGIHYPWETVVQSFLGYFPRADLAENVNAPLWYFTLILAYYLVFPLVYIKKLPLASALIIGVLGYIAAEQILPLNPSVLDPDVLILYRLHIWAFPLGMLLAAAIQRPYQLKLKHTVSLATFRLLSASVVCLFIAWLSLNAGVGQGVWIEQKNSLVLMLCVIGVFLLKPFDVLFFRLFGRYSYELYLLHWPMMYRYDLYFFWLPASLATWAHLFTGIGLGALSKKRSLHPSDADHRSRAKKVQKQVIRGVFPIS